MSISCSESERGTASSSTWDSLCGETMGVGQWWKRTMAVGGAPMMWCSGWRRQNEDVIKWCGEWSRLRWSFYSSWGWELSGLKRVTCYGGADSMLWFRLGRRAVGMKHYWKIKWRQRTRLDSMVRKRDTVQWRDDVGRRRGGTGEGKGRRWRQLGWCEFYWTKKWRKSTRSI
jgi:hypothetical protein